VQGADLGYVAGEVHKIVAASKVICEGLACGRARSGRDHDRFFNGLLIGRSCRRAGVSADRGEFPELGRSVPIIITALPAALAGIVWMLFLDAYHRERARADRCDNVHGFATANSILIVSFARERMAMDNRQRDAALESGFTRFRPVLMTALG